MKSRIGISLFLLIVALVFISLFLILFSLGVHSLYFGEVEQGEKKVIRHYQILQTNPETDEPSYGHVSIYENLGKDEFKYFKHERSDGSEIHTLISHFGTPEFKCTGECFCEHENNRRIPSVIGRGMFYLVAASSSLVAYKIANNHFEEECQTLMKDECSSTHAVQAKVDDCKEYTDKEWREKIEAEEEERYRYEKSNPDKLGDDVKYKCSGACKFDIGGINEFAVRLDPIDKKIDDECQAMFFEEIVMIPRVEDSLEEQKSARNTFDSKHLTFFCRKQQSQCIGSVIGCRKLKDVRYNVEERNIPWGRDEP